MSRIEEGGGGSAFSLSSDSSSGLTLTLHSFDRNKLTDEMSNRSTKIRPHFALKDYCKVLFLFNRAVSTTLENVKMLVKQVAFT